MGELSSLNFYFVNEQYKIWEEKCRDYCIKVCRVQFEAKQSAGTAESPVYEAVEISNVFMGFMDITPDMIDSGSKEKILIVRISKDAVLHYAESCNDNQFLQTLGYDTVNFSILSQQPKGRINLRKERGVTVDQLLFYLVKKADA